MTNTFLYAFQLHLAENPLPSRRRQGAAEKTIHGYVQDVSIFLRWWMKCHRTAIGGYVLYGNKWQFITGKVLTNSLQSTS
jgi:hypothetical protein